MHHHGYRLSPGTVYPILARMAQRGWLRSSKPKRSKAARVYHLTPRGHEVLNQLRLSLDELHGEVGAHDASQPSHSTGTMRLPKRRAAPRASRVAG